MIFLMFYLFSAVLCWLGFRYAIKCQSRKGDGIDRVQLVKSFFIIFIPLLNFIMALAFIIGTAVDENRGKDATDKMLLWLYLIKNNKKED